MKLTITTLADIVFTLEVNDEMELENFKALCSLESNISVESMTVFFNAQQLSDAKKTMAAYGIKDGDMLLLQDNNLSPPTDQPQPGSSGSAPNPFASIDFSSIGLPNDQPSANMREANTIYETLRSNPDRVGVLRVNNPRLADAFEKGFEEFQKVLKVQQEAKQQEERRRLRMLLADPFDTEAQHMIAEEIRRQQIDTNMETAMEYHPESYGEVTMLYINCKVNNNPIKAFVDSGAQMTIMSKACAERCSILRLMDPRFAGIARGVGTQKILGRIHLVQLEISGDFIPSSFIILEHQPMDMLLGLDMLRRYQCTIDLKNQILKIGTTGTETRFLPENEIPKFKEDENESIEKAIQSSLDSATDSRGTNSNRGALATSKHKGSGKIVFSQPHPSS